MDGTSTGCGWDVAYRLQFADPVLEAARKPMWLEGCYVGEGEQASTQNRGKAGRNDGW